MYTYPNTTLKILHNVSLNNDYDHTIYFPTIEAQTAYFAHPTRVKYTLDNQQYQRKERGWIQVDINQNYLWDCTYIMYQNTAYHNKWFYAFILSVEYVNDNVSKINFEIDVMQTWYFNYILEPCFVEREHSASDDYFENTIEEGLELGSDYWVQKNYKYWLDCSRVAIVESGYWDPINDKFVGYTPTLMGKYFTGLHYQCYDLRDEDTTDPNYPHSSEVMYAHIKDYIDHGIEDGIVAIYQYPRFMGRIPSSGPSASYSYMVSDVSFSPELTTIGSYTPKNKKLFTYPYCFIEMDDNQGDTAIYKLEHWYPVSHVGEFRIWGTPFGVPMCMCFPTYYCGETQCLEQGLSMQFDIQNPWVGDNYSIWLARNQKNYELQNLLAGVQTVGGVAKMAITGDTDLIASGVHNLVGNVLNKIMRKNELQATPGTVHGHTSNGLLNLQSTLDSIIFRQKAIKQEYAKIIDEYFSKFGYAMHRVKQPSKHNRQYWSYTKTVGCELTGNIPSDDITKIAKIYDQGVTFWDVRYREIGEYGDFTNPLIS